MVVRETVRAAGGVVSRRNASGETEVVLVHRPRYGDWSLPKGKALQDESTEACALREVEEETGLRCALGEELPSTSYDDSRGRFKIVRYWAMHPVGGTLAPRDEVDDARWLALEAAVALATYERDRALLRASEPVISQI